MMIATCSATLASAAIASQAGEGHEPRTSAAYTERRPRPLGSSQARRNRQTSASRDAENAGEFIDGVRAAFAHFAIAPEVVSGSEEAELSFTGATGDVVAAGHLGPYLVCDIGGGSTELVRGEATATGARVVQSHSADVGCVRMTERHLHSDPPTPDEVAAATADIEAAVGVALQAVPAAGVRTLVGLAGSVTTVTAQAWSLPYYDAHRIHLAVTPVERMRQAARDLLAMNHAHRAALPEAHHAVV